MEKKGGNIWHEVNEYIKKVMVIDIDFFGGLRAPMNYDKDTPPDMLKTSIEALARKLHPEKGSLKRVRISDNSNINANDLYGPDGCLIDFTPARYIPSFNMLDQNQIYLYNYLLPQLKQYIYDGKLLLKAGEMSFDDDSILPSIDDDYSEHKENVKESLKDILIKAENYVSNFVYSLAKIISKLDILAKYRTYIITSGNWRTKFAAIKEMAVALERSFPGLGTSVVNWLIPKLTLTTGKQITFTELVHRYSEVNKKWFEFPYRTELLRLLNQYTTFPIVVRGTQANLLNQPPNEAGFSRLMDYIFKVKNVIANTEFGVGYNMGHCTDKNRHALVAQCICNLLELSNSKMDDLTQHFSSIAKKTASTSLDDVIMLEKLLLFFDEFFNIWIEENENEFDEAYYSPYIPEFIGEAVEKRPVIPEERENFILSSEDITLEILINHWMGWSNGILNKFGSTFGTNSLMVQNNAPYLVMYVEGSEPSEFSQYHWLQNNFNLYVKDTGFSAVRRGTHSFKIPYFIGETVVWPTNDDFQSNPEIKICKILTRWINPTNYIPINNTNSPLRQLLVVKEINHPDANSIYSVRHRDSIADFARWMLGTASRRAQLESILGVGDLTRYSNAETAYKKLKNFFVCSDNPILSSQIIVNRRTYSFKDYYRTRVSHYDKVICYDLLAWLKEGKGFGIENHGWRSRIYHWRKEFDARQLVEDRIPMIYICKNDEAREIILNLDGQNGVIGRKFPLLTMEELEAMTDAWFYAYSQLGQTSFQNFIKNIYTTKNTAMGIKIQEAFGYDTQGQPITSFTQSGYQCNRVSIEINFWNFFIHSATDGKFYSQYMSWREGYPNT